MCLLHSLWKVSQSLDIRVAAAHYNHHLRGEESERDERFVRELTETLGVELISGEGDVAGRAKKISCGIEETAREMRYTFLQEAARKAGAEVIATAHNANDNAETLLMHLLRGTGTRGLSGIPPVRGTIVRPLLTVSREEIEDISYLEYLKSTCPNELELIKYIKCMIFIKNSIKMNMLKIKYYQLLFLI